MGTIGKGRLFGASWGNVFNAINWTMAPATRIAHITTQDQQAIHAMGTPTEKHPSFAELTSNEYKHSRSIVSRFQPMKAAGTDDDGGSSSKGDEIDVGALLDLISRRFDAKISQQLADFIEVSDDPDALTSVIHSTLMMYGEGDLSRDVAEEYLRGLTEPQSSYVSTPEFQRDLAEEMLLTEFSKPRSADKIDADVRELFSIQTKAMAILKHKLGSSMIDHPLLVNQTDVVDDGRLSLLELAVRALDDTAPTDVREKTRILLQGRFARDENSVYQLHHMLFDVLRSVTTLRTDDYYKPSSETASALIGVINSEPWSSPRSFAARLALSSSVICNEEVQQSFRVAAKSAREAMGATASDGESVKSLEDVAKAYLFFLLDYRDDEREMQDEIATLLPILMSMEKPPRIITHLIPYYILARAFRSDQQAADAFADRLLDSEEVPEDPGLFMSNLHILGEIFKNLLSNYCSEEKRNEVAGRKF